MVNSDKMESRKGGLYFILFGFIIGFLGLYFASITESYNIFGYTVTHNPYLGVGIAFISVGFGWFISGIILVLIEERDFNETGGLAVFFLGLLGLILWEVFREKTTYVQTRPKKTCQKCGKEVWFNFTICPRCGEKLRGQDSEKKYDHGWT